jgi:hypothetical protein
MESTLQYLLDLTSLLPSHQEASKNDVSNRIISDDPVDIIFEPSDIWNEV